MSQNKLIAILCFVAAVLDIVVVIMAPNTFQQITYGISGVLMAACGWIWLHMDTWTYR